MYGILHYALRTNIKSIFDKHLVLKLFQNKERHRKTRKRLFLRKTKKKTLILRIMFLKQEKPEMDNFEEETKLVLKEKFHYFKKIFEKCPSFQRIPLQKCHKIFFAYSFVSEHSKHFFSF